MKRKRKRKRKKPTKTQKTNGPSRAFVPDFAERARIQTECEEFFADNRDYVRSVVDDEMFGWLEEAFG